mmetsp:Transcript_18614/g.22743  ORF Transcript_18614/g.22743 Transcript_18614/m.22743 type:complete len:294 (+) Transcript_18614:529-1410(+)|eukprot:CAMPEP_0204851804 /NCGR_PEP_ID=MMETSP1347-20130617/10707_1 /ASSEMBLY_ACC=CAM_ASM_000690 /TAXON_ID=215587 /ORGANISM="Aplanochytrium stocchinoi, Strain GSBS06" /LENGTH=293 /DNA_ID=CAMNT_0051995713 /DNA_START=397 /DNA_END=1278 /DNA_ORIENTATION=-
MSLYASVAQSHPAEEGGLIRIKYESQLVVPLGSSAEDVMQSIIIQSRRNNEAKGITGMLYLSNYSLELLHVMEGPADQLHKLYDVIRQDPRHAGINLLETDKINQRRFNESSMLIVSSNDDMTKIKATLPTGKEWREDQEGFGLGSIDILPMAGDLDMGLIRIIYHSWMNDLSDLPKQNIVIDQILNFAQNFNKRNLIGGMLYYNVHTREVYQFLEGPKNQVEKLYSNIMRDTRHQHVVALLQIPIKERVFKSWGMVWASEEDSKGIFDNLPEGALEQIEIPDGFTSNIPVFN